MKYVILIILGVTVIGLAFGMLQIEQEVIPVKDIQVTNFEECVAAGYPVMESYPRKCAEPNNGPFIEIISIEEIEKIKTVTKEPEIKSVSQDKNYVTIETLKWEVAAKKQECGSFSRQPCLVVNGENLYDPIDDFEYKEGYTYQITVGKYLRFGTTDPDLLPQDVGMFAYRLVSLDSITSTEIKQDLTTPSNSCRISGCSSQLCVSAENAGQISTCEFLPQYACYRTAKCEVQVSGECGWTETEELNQCLQNPTNFEI